jgi:hypothetical protein
MTRTQFQALAVAVALAGGSSLWSSASTAQDDQAADLNLKAETARQAYQTYEVMYAADRATPEDLYRWSRRLMEAELEGDPTNNQPAEDHWNRMRALQRQISALNAAGRAGGEEHYMAAANYYVAEAAADYGR